MFFKKPTRYNSKDPVLQSDLGQDSIIVMDEEDDLVDAVFKINYKGLVLQYYIEIWVVLILIISTIYYIRHKNSTKKSKDFNKSIINKNNEKAKISREKLESNYENDLKTKPIPPPTDNHDYTKKFDKSKSNSEFKSTEGMNPSTTRQRITFTSRDRSCVRHS